MFCSVSVRVVIVRHEIGAAEPRDGNLKIWLVACFMRLLQSTTK